MTVRSPALEDLAVGDAEDLDPAETTLRPMGRFAHLRRGSRCRGPQGARDEIVLRDHLVASREGVVCARPDNNVAAVSARSGDGSLAYACRPFNSIVIRTRESTPHGFQRQAVQDSRPGALQHRISDRPVLARGRGQALSVRTRRFASSLV